MKQQPQRQQEARLCLLMIKCIENKQSRKASSKVEDECNKENNRTQDNSEQEEPKTTTTRRNTKTMMIKKKTKVLQLEGTPRAWQRRGTKEQSDQEE